MFQNYFNVIFILIQINRYTTATRYVIDECEWSTCDCSFNDENPCGPDTHCLNRILYVECSPLKCPAREKCQNQCFVKRQYLECEPFSAERRGWGLKAKAGRFKYLYDPRLVDSSIYMVHAHTYYIHNHIEDKITQI
jgi:hypothetical protein